VSNQEEFGHKFQEQAVLFDPIVEHLRQGATTSIFQYELSATAPCAE
jgi:hypothetical protein